MTPSSEELPANPGLPGGAATNLLHSDDSDDEWFIQAPHRGINLRLPTAALLALAILAGGFWGGALAEQHHGSGSSTSAATAALLNEKAARAGGSTAANSRASAVNGGLGAAVAPVTTGLLTGVEGQTLYLTDASGNLVKVDVGSSATITRTVSSSLAALQTGDTVVVRGTTGANGTVTASSITAAAPGVQSGLGGVGGTLKAGRSGHSGG
jgi:hypothetical protein